MQTAKRLTAVFATIITLISCFTFSASAKNVCKEISGKTDYNGGVSTTFYVKAKNKKKHYVKMDMTKGKLTAEYSWSKNLYDFYEVIVYGKNSNGSYSQLSKTNVKNKGSYKIHFSGYTDYKIKVYSWRTSTINSYGNYCTHIVTKDIYGEAKWKEIPTWKICKTSGVTLCR